MSMCMHFCDVGLCCVKFDMTLGAGMPYVINNNWIIGNFAKIARAKRWGHWFLQDEQRGTCQNIDLLKKNLEEMRNTMSTLKPPRGGPLWNECPKC